MNQAIPQNEKVSLDKMDLIAKNLEERYWLNVEKVLKGQVNEDYINEQNMLDREAATYGKFVLAHVHIKQEQNRKKEIELRIQK
jgi:hypothetical protein